MPRVCSTTLRIEPILSERHERGDPVERFGNARNPVQVGTPQHLDERRDLFREPPRRVRQSGQDDAELFVEVRIRDPVIEAAALQRVVQLARAVRGDDDDRRPRGANRAELRNRHLKVGEQLEEKALERVVGAIDLVDEEDRDLLTPEGPKERALNEERLAEELARRRLAVERMRGLEQPDFEQLPGVVPFVERLGDVDALVALQANELGVERGGQRFGDFRLAHARFAFDEQRPSELQREIDGNRQAAFADVVFPGQKLLKVVDGRGEAHASPFARAPAAARASHRPAPSPCDSPPRQRHRPGDRRLRSPLTCAAAWAALSADAGLPASAASTGRHRRATGSSPPSAMRAQAQVPFWTETIAAAPRTA